MGETGSIVGLRILVVEDSYLVATELSGQLNDLACDVVGPVPSVKEAFEKMDGATLDGALLDVNLNGEMSFPLARALADQGIPFVFLTGYDSPNMFPDNFQQTLRLSKPVDVKALRNAIASHFGR